MNTTTLTSCGRELASDEEHFGALVDSSELLGQPEKLRDRMAEDGYLFLPGALDREQVLEARREVTRRLAEAGHLDPNYPAMEAVAAPTYKIGFLPELAHHNQPLLRLIYTGTMMKIFTDLLGGEVRHFDYTWFRSVAPGLGTSPHCDSVYMNRGTQKLFTAWTPIGDCTLEMGGLMILEGSSRNQRLRETYCATDVDSFCVNRDGRAGKDAWQKGTSGALSRNPVQVQHSLGGRWLTNEYHAGDLLIFSIFTVHASLDNHSRYIRLSCDSRYQLASEAVDERWIGEKPIAHGEAGKRGRIC